MAEIANGVKSLEIRKTKPKELPCVAWLYCSKAKPYLYRGKWFGTYFVDNDKKAHGSDYLNGRIIGKCVIRKAHDLVTDPRGYVAIKENEQTLVDQECWIHKTSLTNQGLLAYLVHGYGYAWEISDLELFDEPMSLSDLGLKRAPQSWCYVNR
jgi:predicted transcriptional regulator